MKFQETEIPGVVLIESEPHSDDRGLFTRIFCLEEFATAGIPFKPTQANISRNPHRHTLRGLHYQKPPLSEAKLVHVIRGAMYDVVVDLRQDSPARGRWIAHNLDARSWRALYIPEGCAHGFLTLEADTDVLYQMNRAYAPGYAQGYRWNDPVLKIRWPAEPRIISSRDLTWPDFSSEVESHETTEI